MFHSFLLLLFLDPGSGMDIPDLQLWIKQSNTVLQQKSRVVDPYSFFPDPDPELDVGGQYGSGSKSGSGCNTDPGL